MSVALSVNLNAVALLRNRRDLPWPDVLHLARVALEAGASGITLHPRPDRRHALSEDVAAIRTLLQTDYPDRELNIEGYPSPDFVSLCNEVKPHQVTLVPDDPRQSTSDHGWEVRAHQPFLSRTISQLAPSNGRVSIFVAHDLDPGLLGAVSDIGAGRIELYTGPYGARHSDEVGAAEILHTLGRTADRALEIGLGVNAGHDLTLDNLPPLIARVPQLAEVSIGHQLIADALEHGMASTVRRFLTACAGSVSEP